MKKQFMSIANRALCVALSTALVVSMAPSFAFAAEASEVEAQQAAAQTVAASGEFDGEIIDLPAAMESELVDIADAVVYLNDVEYSGKPAAVSGTVFCGGKNLVEGQDFVFQDYKNNVITGTATVTLAGMGAYKGTVEATFKIVRSEGNYLALPGKWVKTKKGYRYKYSHNGKHAANRWLQDLNTGKMYRMSSKGYVLRNLQTVDGKRYLFAPVTGYMKTGWREVSGKRYYFDKANGGAAVTGWKTIDGVKYRFGTTGIMKRSSLFTVSGKYYYATKTGAMRTGWLTYKGNRYFFNQDTFQAVIGWQVISDEQYYFMTDATMAYNCVLTIAGKTYGFDADGHLKSGWASRDYVKYYFDPKTHVAKTGVFTLDGQKYIADSEGAIMKSRMVKTSSSQASFTDENGRIARTGTIDSNGKVFLVATADDPEVTGWKEIGGAVYRFSLTNKYMLTGWKTIDGHIYYFDENNGAMARNVAAQRDDGSWWFMGDNGRHQKKGSTELVLNYAKKMVAEKAPYIWGGNYLTQHGTDCSGLVYYSYLHAGVKLGRTTYVQQYEGKRVGKTWSAMVNAKPGDIILMYYSAPKTPEHVVMYAGKNSAGEYMIYEEPNFNMHAQKVKLSSKVATTAQIEIRRILA